MLTLNFRDFAAAGSYAESSVAIEPTNTEHETVSATGGGCSARGETFRINDSVVRHDCYIKYFAFVCLKSSAILNPKQVPLASLSRYSVCSRLRC